MYLYDWNYKIELWKLTFMGDCICHPTLTPLKNCGCHPQLKSYGVPKWDDFHTKASNLIPADEKVRIKGEGGIVPQTPLENCGGHTSLKNYDLPYGRYFHGKVWFVQGVKRVCKKNKKIALSNTEELRHWGPRGCGRERGWQGKGRRNSDPFGVFCRVGSF